MTLALLPHCRTLRPEVAPDPNRELARAVEAPPSPRRWVPLSPPLPILPPRPPQRAESAPPSSPVRHGVMPTGLCSTRRKKALFRDTVQSFAERNHVTAATFLRMNGLALPATAPLQHRRLYVVAVGADGERLVGGKSLGPSTAEYVVVNPSRAFGQPFAVDLLRRAIARVHARLPGGQRIVIEDLSIEHGGCLAPHREHRGGLEADVGFFHHTASRHLTVATAANFDAPREWLFLRTLLETGLVQMIIVDRRVQALLHREALRQGTPEALLRRWLQFPRGKGSGATVVHGGGHDNHTHIKFRCPRAGCAAPATLADDAATDLPASVTELELP